MNSSAFIYLQNGISEFMDLKSMSLPRATITRILSSEAVEDKEL